MTSHDSAAWARAIETLLPSIHEVDRNATFIWFRFHPLALNEALARADNAPRFAQILRLDGRYRLADESDTSHSFLYGHRFWPLVKSALVTRADAGASAAGADLTAFIREVARQVATAAKVDETLVIGIAAAGVMTLQQVGLAAFRATPGTVDAPSGLARKSPDQIVAARKKDDGQGLAGLLRGPEKAQYTVTFDERRADGRFTVIRNTPMTNGSALDTRDYSSGPRRCHEGPIPIECRTASCGTCWVGVLEGAGKLSAVDTQESKLMKECGYLFSDDSKPIIRLACKAFASGNVTIAIPSWNGFVAKGGVRVD